MQNKIYFNIAKFDAIIDTDVNLERLDIYKRQPDLSHIQPVDRRRLSKGGRMCASLLKYCRDIPIVFSSELGEINRCISMLDDIANNHLLSPNSFSVSVHNAMIAQSAIFTKNVSEMSAISANLSLENAIVCSVSKLNDTNGSVAIVSYFEDINNELIIGSDLIYALFLLIECGNNFSLTMLPNNESKNETKNSDFIFLNNMLSNQKSWKVFEKDITWLWSNETII